MWFFFDNVGIDLEIAFLLTEAQSIQDGPRGGGARKDWNPVQDRTGQEARYRFVVDFVAAASHPAASLFGVVVSPVLTCGAGAPRFGSHAGRVGTRHRPSGIRRSPRQGRRTRVPARLVFIVGEGSSCLTAAFHDPKMKYAPRLMTSLFWILFDRFERL